MRLIGGTKKTEIFILMDIYHIKKYNATKLHVKYLKKNAVNKECLIPTNETQVLQFSLYSDYLHESSVKFWTHGDVFSNYFWNSGEIYHFHYRSPAKKRTIKWKILKSKIHNKIVLIMLYLTTEKANTIGKQINKNSRTKQIKSHEYWQSKMLLLHCKTTSTQTRG